MKKFLLVLVVIIFIIAIAFLFDKLFIKKANGEALMIVVGEEQLVEGVYKTPIRLAEGVDPAKVASFQCKITIASEVEKIQIEDPHNWLKDNILKGENPPDKILAMILSSVSLKDKAEITLSEIKVEMELEAQKQDNAQKAPELDPVKKLDQLLDKQDELQSSIDDLYETGLNKKSLAELEAEEARLQADLENLQEETSTLLSIYGKKDELKERGEEKKDVKDASSPYREAAKLKAETDRGDRYLRAYRQQRYLAEKKIAQDEEKKRLRRKIAALKPPREKFILLSLGVFGSANSYYEDDNYYSSKYTEPEYTTSNSGYFAEICVRTPSIGERIEGGFFAALTSAKPGWYGGAEVRLILADEGYRCLLTAGILMINSVHPKIGLIVDSPSWTFFVAGIPGAENNVQIGLGYKL